MSADDVIRVVSIPGCGLHNDAKMLATLRGPFCHLRSKQYNVFEFQDFKESLTCWKVPSDPSRKGSKTFLDIMLPRGIPCESTIFKTDKTNCVSTSIFQLISMSRENIQIYSYYLAGKPHTGLAGLVFKTLGKPLDKRETV